VKISQPEHGGNGVRSRVVNDLLPRGERMVALRIR
jgi:hypothetical protein